MTKEALLIIDSQAAVFTYTKDKLYNEEKVIDNIGILIKKARKAGIPVIFVQHSDLAEEKFAKGKIVWALYPKIKPLADEVIIEKTTCDSFHKTNLHEILQLKCVNKLVIAGMQTEYSVDTTCRQAFSFGYKNILVKDAHSTFNSNILNAKQIVDHHNNVLGDIIELKATEEIRFTELNKNKIMFC